MWVAIVATIRQFRPVIGDLALLLLVPYLVWVSYASALTFWIWRNNPTRTGRVSWKL
jgi:tryptophan-rich sensory protein